MLVRATLLKGPNRDLLAGPIQDLVSWLGSPESITFTLTNDPAPALSAVTQLSGWMGTEQLHLVNFTALDFQGQRAILEALKNSPADIDVVFSTDGGKPCPELTKLVGKRVLDTKAPERGSKAAFIQEVLSSTGRDVTKAQVSRLEGIYANDGAALAKSLRRLVVGSGPLTPAELDSLDPAKDPVWRILDFYTKGQTKNALLLVEQVREGKNGHPLQLFTMLKNRLVHLVHAQDGGKDALTAAGVSAWASQDILRASKGLKPATLGEEMDALRTLSERARKGAEGWDELTSFLVGSALRKDRGQ